MWPRLALDSTLLPQALSCCWGSSCITTPIQWMLNFCHFLPCKYFDVFKVIWFQPSTIRSFLSCLYYKHSCDPQVIPLHSALRILLSNVVTRHMEMQPCVPRTLAFVLASLNSLQGALVCTDAYRVQVLGTLNLGTVLCLFLEAGPSYNLWQILDFLHGKGMLREKVCIEFQGKKPLHRFT